MLEDAEMALADGTGADNEKSHENAGSTRQGLMGDPTLSGRLWQRGKRDISVRDGGSKERSAAQTRAIWRLSMVAGIG